LVGVLSILWQPDPSLDPGFSHPDASPPVVAGRTSGFSGSTRVENGRFAFLNRSFLPHSLAEERSWQPDLADFSNNNDPVNSTRHSIASGHSLIESVTPKVAGTTHKVSPLFPCFNKTLLKPGDASPLQTLEQFPPNTPVFHKKICRKARIPQALPRRMSNQ